MPFLTGPKIFELIEALSSNLRPWGTDWGMKGDCTMPYEYLLDAQLASDFWTIQSVTG
jgi:hypothetical protein